MQEVAQPTADQRMDTSLFGKCARPIQLQYQQGKTLIIGAGRGLGLAVCTFVLLAAKLSGCKQSKGTPNNVLMIYLISGSVMFAVRISAAEQWL